MYYARMYDCVAGLTATHLKDTSGVENAHRRDSLHNAF